MVSSREPGVTPILVDYGVIASLKSEAAREGVSLGCTQNTEWYAVLMNDLIVGVAGLIRIRTGFRFKGFYVTPEQRGNGIGRILLDYLMQICSDRCASVEVLTRCPDAYLKRGFVAIGRTPHGVIKMLKRA